MLATATELDDHLAMRRAGADLLSLALMDARNHSLQLHTAVHSAWAASGLAGSGGPIAVDAALQQALGCPHPDLWLGRLGWFQEAWIARNVQRRRGRGCDPQAARLASIDPDADLLWDARQADARGRPALPLPRNEALRQYLADTLEVTLELLQAHPQDDDSLYFFRLALFHEDEQAERLLALAHALGLALPQLRWPELQPRAATLPLPGGSQRLGWGEGEDGAGFTFEADRGSVVVPLHGGDIDATPVTWQQYLEFIRDGGYEDRQWWSEAGWRWCEALERRAPRQVLSAAGAVIAERGGRHLRVAVQQPVLQVSAYEAQAWCAWAGRRLPTEAEWQAAALGLVGRGWRWGECWEWTLDRLAQRPVPGPSTAADVDHNPPEPAAGHPQHLGSAWGRHLVLRGGALTSRRRMVHARRRWHAAPECDRLMVGFRSCGL